MSPNISELLTRIKELEEENRNLRNDKKYGLIWEDKPEEFNEKSRNSLPILQEDTSLRIDDSENKPYNIIIEWDNYHSLSALSYTHQGKIDVIYIDPPYNTGNEDFIYNDNYVNKEDSYRHSKWLSFMKKRLDLAKNLLKNDWVIFISIDDNEFAQLKLLCDSIFGEENSIWPILWQRASWWWNAKKVVKGHEYILCYSRVQKTLTQKNEKHKNVNYKKSEKYIQKWNEIYFINDDIIRKVFGKYESWVERRCEYEDLLVYKNEKIKAEVDEKIKKWEYILKANPNNPNKHFICRLEKLEGKRMKLYSIIFWILNNEWKDDLEKIFWENNNFDYPKPVRFIKFILDSLESTNSIILDFFAWSGTTGHAVLELNKEDWWNRQFILCSNRENIKEDPEKNICRDITYERNKRVIQGYTNAKWEQVEGLGGNLRYYKTTFINKNPSIDDLRYSFIHKCDDLLCIKENTFTKIPLGEDIPTLRVFGRKNLFTVILYDINLFETLKEKLRLFGQNEHISLYLFTMSHPEIFMDELRAIHSNIDLKNIPDDILETYLKIFNA